MEEEVIGGDQSERSARGMNVVAVAVNDPVLTPVVIDASLPPWEFPHSVRRVVKMIGANIST